MNLLQRLVNRLRGKAPQESKVSESDIQSDPVTANTRTAVSGTSVGVCAADEPENEETGAEARVAQLHGLRDDDPDDRADGRGSVAGGGPGHPHGGGAKIVGGGGSGNPPRGGPSNSPGSGPHGGTPGTTPSTNPDGSLRIAPDGSLRTGSDGAAAATSDEAGQDISGTGFGASGDERGGPPGDVQG